jgi:tetratricopeptide (TPR) repeat protein
MKPFLFILTTVSLAVLAGCGLSRDGARSEPAQKLKQQVNEQLNEMRRDRALSHVIQGAVYDATGDYANAILEYQEGLQLEPSAAIQYALSKDYSLLGKHALAAQHGREAVRLDSLNVGYHQNLAGIYLNAHQPEFAAAEFEKVVRIDSNDAEGWYNLARIYQSTKPLRALEIYERMLDRDGDDWEILLQAAEVYTALGRFDEAAEKYKRMVELDPSNKVLQRQLAETYSRAGKPAEAIKVLKGILETDDNNPDALAALADVYLEQQDFPQALKLYEKLLTMERTNPEVRLLVGVAYVGKANL